jgi:hypothetical protein
MSKRRSSAELRAMGFAIADEIETRAQRFIDAGMDRQRALHLAIAEASGHLVIVKG